MLAYYNSVSHSKSKETSVILWLYDFFWQFEQFYSIITVLAQMQQQNILTHYCNNIFQRVVKKTKKKRTRRSLSLLLLFLMIWQI